MIYSGARCDVESYIYMPLLEELGYLPSEKYATGKEIRTHFTKIAQKWNLNKKTIFQTEVRDLIWDEKTSQWNVSTDRNDNLHARFVVTAPGILHTPKLPGIPGITTFKGHSFHTTRWDYDYTGGRRDEKLTGLKDKRVALIGTGATSIQVVPAVAPYAKKLYVFQRTPAAVNVRNNRPTDPSFASTLKPGWQKQRIENFNAILGGQPQEEDLVQDGWTDNKSLTLLIGGGPEENNEMDVMEKMRLADIHKMESIRARVDEVVKDKATAEKLKPWYPSICKRPCFHDEYLKAFNIPATTLVDTNGKGLEKITETSIVANGKEYEVDLIIYSTGFVSPQNGYKHTGMKIAGRGGNLLTDHWRIGGISTLFGSQMRGFPNYFNIGVLQSGVGVNFMYTLDTHAKHLAYVISECDKQGFKTVEPSAEAEENWVAGIVESGKAMRGFFSNCTPSYYNNEGNLSDATDRESPYGEGCNAWAKLLEDWRERGGMEGLETEKGSVSARL